MTGVPGMIVFIIGLVVIVLISTLKKLNMGVVGIAVAFILGMINKVSPTAVVTGFNASLFFMQFAVSFFFAFITSTGVFTTLCKKLLKRFANKTWAIPLVIWACSAVITLLGGGGSTGVIMSAFAFNIALAAGVHPLLCCVAIYTGNLWAS